MEDLITIALYGVGAMIILLLLLGIAVTMIQIFGQRSIQHIAEISHNSLLSLHSLGMNAIIASNEMVIVDGALENRSDTKIAIKKIEANTAAK